MATKSNSARKGLAAALIIAVIGPRVSVRVAATPPGAGAVTTFLTELRRAINADDRSAVASLVQFPLVVLAGDLRIPIADRAALLHSYDVVFSPALKNTIAQAGFAGAGRAEPAARVTISETFVTIGSDLIRLQTVGGALKIVRIREPLSGAAVKSSGHTELEPRRLTLRVGRTQLSGTLAANDHDAYIVTATKNQLIDARITGVTGRDIVVRVANAKTHEPVDPRARDGVRTWTGRVPDDGEYEIDVVRLAAGEPRLAYVLAISMR
jgi:hypothetical protein